MLVSTTILFFLTTFVVVGVIVAAVGFARDRLGPAKPEETEPLARDFSPILRDEAISTISVWGKLLGKFDFITLMKNQIDQADLKWSVGRFTSLMLLTGTIALVILINGDWLPGWGNAAIAYAACLLPWAYVWRCRSKRFAKFEAQFPDALDSIARALRAGHPFAGAFDIVASECEAPVSTELRRTAVEGNFGASWQSALENLANRVPLLEVHMFAAAVQLHNRTGGKLSEVLSTLSEGMREASSLKGEVRAIAAHGKMTGLVLTVLPPVIALVMAMVNPSYLKILIDSPAGKMLLGASVVCLILAHFVIRRIVDIKV